MQSANVKFGGQIIDKLIWNWEISSRRKPSFSNGPIVSSGNIAGTCRGNHVDRYEIPGEGTGKQVSQFGQGKIKHGLGGVACHKLSFRSEI
jgi:hypothetical protein